MDLVTTILILVLAMQTVYLFYIHTILDRMIDTYNSFAPVTVEWLEELAEAVEEIKAELKESK